VSPAFLTSLAFSTCLYCLFEGRSSTFLTPQLFCHTTLKGTSFSLAFCHLIHLPSLFFYNFYLFKVLFTHWPKVFILVPALLFDAIIMHTSTALANFFLAALTFTDTTLLCFFILLRLFAILIASPS